MIFYATCLTAVLKQERNLFLLYSALYIKINVKIINAEKIIAVKYATYTVAKEKHQYCWGQGLDPSKPEFFKAFFLQLHDDLCIYFFILQFKYLKFI